MAAPQHTVCKIEVLGRVCSLSYCRDTNCILASTVLNGAHIFCLHDNFYGTQLSTGLASQNVESYSSEVLTENKKTFISSCFVGNGNAFVLGSSNSEIVTVSRSSRAVASSLQLSENRMMIRTLVPIEQSPSSVLLCTDKGGQIVDVQTSTIVASYPVPAPRAVGALSVDPHTVAVANYDGKVLLFDSREGRNPHSIFSVPDQICSFAVCSESHAVCCGTVGGRVFTLRCSEQSVLREEAFATGKTRSPIRALGVSKSIVAAGDVSGRLSVLDISDVPSPTTYWSPKHLFSLNLSRNSQSDTPQLPNWDNAEVTAVALSGGTVWGSFGVHGSDHSHVVALPS